MFSKVLGLKFNSSKYEVWNGDLKGINLTLCGLQYINIKKESLKILGIHFSYNKELEQEKHFECHIVKIENVLKLWKGEACQLKVRLQFSKLKLFQKCCILV